MEDSVYKRHIDNFNKHWWFQGRKKIIENCISSIITNKKNQILDYGAGSGVNVEMLSKFGRLDIYEPHSQTQKYLKKKFRKNNIKVINDVKNRKYDLIVLADVLEHIKKDHNQIVKLTKNLNEKGKILVTVPAYEFLFTKKDHILGHYRRYNLTQLKKVFYKFKTLKLCFFNFFLFIPISFILLLFKILKKDFIDDVEKKPSKAINKILYLILLLESKLITTINFPIGISILGIFEKKR